MSRQSAAFLIFGAGQLNFVKGFPLQVWKVSWNCAKEQLTNQLKIRPAKKFRLVFLSRYPISCDLCYDMSS